MMLVNSCRFFCQLGMIFLMCNFSYAQESIPPVSELQRRFIQLEQRALKLSEQIADTTGTEPIQLFDRNETLGPVEIDSSAQQSYDSLPGPTVTPLALPEKKTEEPKPTVFQSEVNRVVATTQQRKGDYYLMPIWGLAVATNTTYSSDSLDDELDGEWGNSIGLSAGKRWDNWMLYGRIAYQYLEYDNPSFKGVPGVNNRASGIEESYSLSVGAGYSIPLVSGLSTFGGAGIGLGWRKNSADIEYEVTSGGITDWYYDDSGSSSESSLVFTYDFSMGLEYLFKNNFSAILGYRLLGLTSNKSFEGSFQHLIELGVGANF
jgi:opacity protein-like surface antigen